jgi:hypothetical protein
VVSLARFEITGMDKHSAPGSISVQLSNDTTLNVALSEQGTLAYYSTKLQAGLTVTNATAANRVAGLVLAVIAGLVLVIAASSRTGTTTLTPHSGTSPNGTVARRGSDQPGPASHTRAALGVAQPRRTASPPRSSAGSRSNTRYIASPATPTDVTIDSPQGTPILSAPIDPMTAQRNADGSWASITPPSLTRAVWMSRSAMPAAPSKGTTAIYGHACIGLICAFNNVVNTPRNSTVIVRTRAAVLRYRVTSLTQYPKVGAQSLESRRDIANQLLLITCAYRSDVTSANNLVLVAILVGTQPQ